MVFSLLVRSCIDAQDTPTTLSKKDTLAMIHKHDLGFSRVLCHSRLYNSLLAFSWWLCSRFQARTPLVELILYQCAKYLTTSCSYSWHDVQVNMYHIEQGNVPLNRYLQLWCSTQLLMVTMTCMHMQTSVHM